MSRRYAEQTRVPVSRSVQNIIRLLERFGACDYVQGRTDGRTQILFKYGHSAVRIRVPQSEDEQEERRLWRCAEMSVKAKLVSVEEGIEIFEEAFLAHIVVRGGKTVGEELIPEIQDGKLPGPNVRKLLTCATG